MWPIDRPIPYARNPRNISETAISKVAASLKEFDFRQPIVVDEEGVILVGHTRLLAAQRLGRTEIPVHVARGLTENQAKAYRIADNRVGEESNWQDELLGLEILDLREMGGDLASLGFEAGELETLLGAQVPSLDQLAEEWGEHEERSFWPVIKLSVPPETHDAFKRLMGGQPGKDDAEKFAALLALIDDPERGELDDAA